MISIRHATLINVYGTPAKHAGFTIVPADFEFVASCSSSSHALAEIPSQLIPPILKNPLTNHFEVAWVRARIPSVFKITPDPTEIEKTVLFMGFVAVAENKMEGVPFWCSDYYGRTSLYPFSERLF